jgi:hypothetical protein
MTDWLVYYHWSPADRAKSIFLNGLVPGSKPAGSAQHPAVTDSRPVVCLASTPEEGWSLSGGCDYDDLPEGDWILWQVYVDPAQERHERTLWGRPAVEVRVFETIPAKHVRYVAHRERTGVQISLRRV